MANKIKGLTEKLNNIIAKMEELVAALGEGSEARAFSEDEQRQYNDYKKEAESLNETISSIRNAIKSNAQPMTVDPTGGEVRSASAVINAFVRGKELRAGEMSKSENGNIIPTEFSSDIIKKVTERSGITQMVSKVRFDGTYKQIVAKNKISSGWTPELAEVTKSAADYGTLDIEQHKLGALTIISNELIKDAAFNVADDVRCQIVDDFTSKIEESIIKGTGIKQPTGLTTSGTPYEIPAKLTTDCAIKIYHSLKAPYLTNSSWIMSRQTLCAFRTLKDGNGRFLFQDDLNNGFVGHILGRPVLVSEFMDEIEPGKKPILFGDFRAAYKANIGPEMFIQILHEVYAIQGAKGMLGFMFIDGKPVNSEAYVTAFIAGSEGEAGA